MSRSGRKLSEAEAAMWARVAKTVTPLGTHERVSAVPVLLPARPPTGRVAAPAREVQSPRRGNRPATPPPVAAARPLGSHGLDTGWERKLARGQVAPDFTLDLHGCTLDAAYSRLLHGMAQARAMGARAVLLITGKSRPVDAADRNTRRGAIRAKTIDWLAASEHAADIAAIRGAHPRHGGQGALYIILKRRRR